MEPHAALGADDDDDPFGETKLVDMRPRWAVEGNPAYVALELEGHAVFLRMSALEQLIEHGKAHRVEVAFLCMGRRAKDPSGVYTIVEALPLVAIGASAHVEMPVDAKLAAHREHPAFDVVGWTHTHPGFGVFFSKTDVTNCAQYGPQSINLVYDPRWDELGIALGAEMLLERTVRTRGRGRKRRVELTPMRPPPAEPLRAKPRPSSSARPHARVLGIGACLALIFAAVAGHCAHGPTAMGVVVRASP